MARILCKWASTVKLLMVGSVLRLYLKSIMLKLAIYRKYNHEQRRRLRLPAYDQKKCLRLKHFAPIELWSGACAIVPRDFADTSTHSTGNAGQDEIICSTPGIRPAGSGWEFTGRISAHKSARHKARSA